MKEFVLSSVALVVIGYAFIWKCIGAAPVIQAASSLGWDGASWLGDEPLETSALSESESVVSATLTMRRVATAEVDEAAAGIELSTKSYLFALRSGLDLTRYETAMTADPQVTRRFIDAMLSAQDRRDANYLATGLASVPTEVIRLALRGESADTATELAWLIGTDHLESQARKSLTRKILRAFIVAQERNDEIFWSQYLFALSQCTSDEALETIAEEFYAEKVPARRLAIFYFVEQHPERLADVVASALHDPDEAVNWNAFDALSDWVNGERRRLILEEAFKRPLPASIRVMMLSNVWEQRQRLPEIGPIVSEVASREKDQAVRSKALALLKSHEG